MLSSWMLFELRHNIWLINIFKTVWFLKIIFCLLKKLVNKNFPIWFINCEMTKQYIIDNDALNCGEFYCGYIWKRGLLSNYLSMIKVIKKVVSKDFIYQNRDFFLFI
jgi:ribosomal protein S2